MYIANRLKVESNKVETTIELESSTTSLLQLIQGDAIHGLPSPPFQAGLVQLNHVDEWWMLLADGIRAMLYGSSIDSVLCH